ncbi:unnamed protein product [Oikopleura dioica]|uniref:Uncharacterized protein n=1 Tax=Oikopleura dioica TaxID=34765 RepID=E4XYC8_OIKDI|nr:unnamed protein product [Oikopleura dioica]
MSANKRRGGNWSRKLPGPDVPIEEKDETISQPEKQKGWNRKIEVIPTTEDVDKKKKTDKTDVQAIENLDQPDITEALTNMTETQMIDFATAATFSPPGGTLTGGQGQAILGGNAQPSFFENMGAGAAYALGGTAAITGSCYAWRKMAGSKPVFNLALLDQDESAATTATESLLSSLISEEEAAPEKFCWREDSEMIVFFYKKELELLDDVGKIKFGLQPTSPAGYDGTFYTVRDIPYEQLFSMCVYKTDPNDSSRGLSIPVVMAFLKGRKATDYINLLNFIKEVFQETFGSPLKISYVIGDFECASRKAFVQVFKNIGLEIWQREDYDRGRQVCRSLQFTIHKMLEDHQESLSAVPNLQ